MLKLHGSQLGLLGGMLLVFVGCGGDPEAPPVAGNYQQGRTAWCEAACSYSNRCTAPVPTYCVSNCLNSNASYFEAMRSEYLVKAAQCISNATCAADWSTMSKACYESTAPTVVAAPSVIDFCKSMSSEFFDCFFADDDLTFCAGDFAPWSDSALARAKVCATAECASLNDCLSTAFSGTN